LASLYFIVRTTTTPDSPPRPTPPRSHTKHHALSHPARLFCLPSLTEQRPKWCARSGAHHLMMAQMDHTLNERTHTATVSADNAVIIIQWIWSYFPLGWKKKKKKREIGIHYSFVHTLTLLSSADNNNKSFQTKLFLSSLSRKGWKTNHVNWVYNMTSRTTSICTIWI
jgi:hypothetical protein